VIPLWRSPVGKLPRQSFSPHPWKISLPWILTIPFILEVGAVVGIVGYLSYRNGQRSVEDLTGQLMSSVSTRVEQKLSSYLATASQANQSNSDAVLRGSLDLNLDRPNSQRDQYLWQQMQQYQSLAWISLGTETGDSLGIWRPENTDKLQISGSNKSTQYFGNYYATDDFGNRTQLLKVEKPAFDPRTRPWYQEAIAAKQRVWTKIYPGFTSGTVFLAASQPLYDSTGKLLGVSGVDISLLGIQKFLAETPVSSNGAVFVVEKSGMLVASSSQEALFRQVIGGIPQRLNVVDSQNSLVSSTAKFIAQQTGGFRNIQQTQKFQFNIDGKQQFVQVLPIAGERGLDWSIVIVVPEADVMSRIHVGTLSTALFCLTAALIVILLNSVISRWLSRSIKNLNEASQNIARGNFGQKIADPGIQEFSILANSFDQMSQEIQQSRRQLEEYSRSLEQKVQERTQDLEDEIARRAVMEMELQAANRELEEMAYLDGLTHIANRRQFDERLQQEWCRMQRDNLPLSLIICDIDYFKQYNDAYGHSEGDGCLRQVAQAVYACARRASDLSARYGGEEFVALLPNTPDAGAVQVAKSIQQLVKSLRIPHIRSEVSHVVTLSFGIATMMPSNQNSPEELILRADRALYKAKQAGRDQILSSSPM
jgi:diguanylate cyclase (GGDEF)-like protein